MQPEGCQYQLINQSCMLIVSCTTAFAQTSMGQFDIDAVVNWWANFLRYTPKDRKKNASLAKKTVLDGLRSISQ